MKKVYLIILILFVAVPATAQQLPQFTQYMYNTISINPAYAGSRDGFSVTALNRNQWAGINGAPNTQTLSIHSPLRNDKVGLGLSVINDKAGYENYTYLYSDFSYRLDLSADVSLNLGLLWMIHSFRINSINGHLTSELAFIFLPRTGI